MLKCATQAAAARHGRLRGERLPRVDEERLAAQRGHCVAGQPRGSADGVVDEPLHLGDDQELDALPLADAAHAVGALGIVAEGQVLGERERGVRGVGLWDVHARRVHLRGKGGG